MRGEDETQPHQRLAEEPGGTLPKMARSAWPCARASVRWPEHRFDQLDARVAALLAQAIEAGEQQPGREDHLDRDGALSPPSRPTAFAPTARERRLVEEVAARPVQQLAVAVSSACGRRSERLHAELGLELLHPVGHDIALVEGCRGLGIASLFDDRDQGAHWSRGMRGSGIYLSLDWNSQYFALFI